MKKVAIIGAGQQGRSLAEALAFAGKYSVSITDKDPGILERVSRLVDHENIHISETALGAVQDADIIILATPIDRFAGVLQEIQAHVKPGAILTDVGSGKQKSIFEISRNLPEGAVYVPSHPIAGKAGVGPETGSADLYKGQAVVVIPQGPAKAAEQVMIEQMWEGMGARITHMSALAHDRLYGTVSHFQHVIAFAQTLAGEDKAQSGQAEDDYKRAYNTLLDTTRISVASAPMWLAVFKDNKASIQQAAQGFKAQLSDLKTALASDNPDRLFRLIEESHNFRTGIPETRPRETVWSEVADFSDEKRQGLFFMKEGLFTTFNEASEISLAKRITVPTLISAALTLNAKDISGQLGKYVSLADNANPSFKDGSAAMLSHPEYLTNLLYFNRDEIFRNIGRFETHLDTIMDAIEQDDSAKIEQIIERASAIRQSMPAHKQPEEMRGDRVVEYNKYRQQLPRELDELMQHAL